MKKKKENDWEKRRKSFVISTLRRGSLKWEARNIALAEARVERGQYKCASCNDLFGRTEINLDHKNPIVSLKGFTNWDDYINGLLCSPDGFQILCVACHNAKTSMEDAMRTHYKQKKKIDKSE